MFATRRALKELTRELQRIRFVVSHLRRDLNLAQGQLQKLDGWGDDLVKTRQIPDRDPKNSDPKDNDPKDGDPKDSDTKFLDREFLSRSELNRQEFEPQEFGPESASLPSFPHPDEAPHSERSQAEGPADSGVRRRFG